MIGVNGYGQVWPPPVDPKTLSRQVWDATSARTLPGVGRALGVYGMVVQCALLHLQGTRQLPRRPFLERPDPDMALPTFIGAHVDDYLLHGNAAHLITSLDAEGYPASVRWYPAHRWGILPDRDGQPVYHLDGREVPRERVVHVQRGADPTFPYRGVGVVEQHLATFNRAGLQEAAETANLRDRGMPSVVIIKPNTEPDPTNDDLVAAKWVERFGGQTGAPGIFPKGTEVTPLSWNPSDQQLIEARQMTLKDQANAFNLDAYWMNGEGATMSYKSPGPMYLTLLRTSLNPVLAPFEDQWSFQWLPRGRRVGFDRTVLLRDDLLTMVQAFAQGKSAGIFPDPNEARDYLGFGALTDEQLALAAAAAPAPLPAPPTPAPDEDGDDPEETP